MFVRGAGDLRFDSIRLICTYALDLRQAFMIYFSHLLRQKCKLPFRLLEDATSRIIAVAPVSIVGTKYQTKKKEKKGQRHRNSRTTVGLASVRVKEGGGGG